MDRGFCGMPFPENEFLSIFRWLEKPKDQISLLTTNKELYQRIPRLEIDKTIAFRYLCNNYDRLNDEEFLSPVFFKSIPNVVELRCGDPSFPLQIQFLVFTRFFSLGHLTSPLKLLIDSKKGPQDGEVDALLMTMDTKDPILDAIKSLEICFLRINENFDLVCNKLPNLEQFSIKPIEALLVEKDASIRYNKLFSERNLTFNCDMGLFCQSSSEEYLKNEGYIDFFKSLTFRNVDRNRHFLGNEKEHIFGFRRKEV